MISNGERAEQIVASAYQKKGFKIIKRNFVYRSNGRKQGEIDIIATKKKHLHIIEVKFRASGHQYALDHIQQHQLKRIKTSYRFFISSHQEYVSWTAQIDVALVSTNSIDIIPNIDC